MAASATTQAWPKKKKWTKHVHTHTHTHTHTRSPTPNTHTGNKKYFESRLKFCKWNFFLFLQVCAHDYMQVCIYACVCAWGWAGGVYSFYHFLLLSGKEYDESRKKNIKKNLLLRFQHNKNALKRGKSKTKKTKKKNKKKRTNKNQNKTKKQTINKGKVESSWEIRYQLCYWIILRKSKFAISFYKWNQIWW